MYNIAGYVGVTVLRTPLIKGFSETKSKLNIFSGFICPFVPLLPIVCILVNIYLLINLGWVNKNQAASNFAVLWFCSFYGSPFLFSQNAPSLPFSLWPFSAATWTRVSVWLIVGVLVYVFYGRKHSSLRDAVYVPATHADEIYRSSGESLA